MVKTTLLRPAAATWRALETHVDSLGAEWHVDLELTGTYDGNATPLSYALTPAERIAFLQDFPQFAEPGYTADPGVQRGLCLAGRQFCFIDAFGNVYPCLSFKAASDAREAQTGGGGTSARMGNILTSSFADVWNAPVAQRIRAIERSDFKTCASCDGRAACSPCMAANFEASGDLVRPAPSICERTTIRLADHHPNFIPASRLIARAERRSEPAAAMP
jgi:radical SAM protein with 4Fe4S-binding SPASM domain